ncbi:MAG: hypothetical protein EXR06_02250 [Rickettsiales bacterium]|nr:hypothetical protein [Rickettsiales bacterium]
MEKKPQELSKEEQAQKAEYQQFVKDAAFDGSYFKDALDWYMLRYVSPLCDRTTMMFVSIIGAISIFCLIQIIDGLFPLVEKVPIVIRAKDQSRYTPFIKSLRSAGNKELSVDDAIAKYLLAVYVNDRESYDYRKSEVEDVNRKFNRIKNTSSYSEYKNFQLFMSKDNEGSPLNDFGYNVFRTIETQSVTFVENQNQDYYSKLKTFFESTLPSEAEVRFAATMHSFDENNNEKKETTNYLVKIKFNFSGAHRNTQSGFMSFVTNSYKLYKIK